MINKFFCVIILFFYTQFLYSSISFYGFEHFKKGDYDLNVYKYGPYVGIQRGLYSQLEFGVEHQLKELKLFNPITHAINAGINYNFKSNVMGIDASYWFKKGRFNLTYGTRLLYKTNYKDYYFGFAPLIGIKFSQFHLQTGFNFIRKDLIPVNTLFMSLRFVIINKRKYNLLK